MIYSNKFFFWYVKYYFKFKRERDSQMGAGEKLTLIWELTTTFVTFWNICVALKRAVSVNIVTAVWYQWSLSGILVAEAFLQSTWAICVWIFQGKLVSILVVDSRICLFHRLRFVSVFCIIFVTLDSFLGDRYFVVTCYYIGWINQ